MNESKKFEENDDKRIASEDQNEANQYEKARITGEKAKKYHSKLKKMRDELCFLNYPGAPSGDDRIDLFFLIKQGLEDAIIGFDALSLISTNEHDEQYVNRIIEQALNQSRKFHGYK